MLLTKLIIRRSQVQIAYGLHRLTALKELKIQTIEIPIKSLDDSTMIKIMANENLEDWRLKPSVYNETVLSAKKFLDAKLARCDDYKKLRKISAQQFNVHNAKSFAKLKEQGVGRKVIHNFLGGSWKQKSHIIQDALNTINETKAGRIDPRAVDELPSYVHSETFKILDHD